MPRALRPWLLLVRPSPGDAEAHEQRHLRLHGSGLLRAKALQRGDQLPAELSMGHELSGHD